MLGIHIIKTSVEEEGLVYILESRQNLLSLVLGRGGTSYTASVFYIIWDITTHTLKAVPPKR